MKSVASLILLAIMLCILIVVIRIYKRLMSEKTAMEKDAINKGLLAYFITDSPILGWFVYRKNDPKNRLKQ
jgi:hypothetical protein